MPFGYDTMPRYHGIKKKNMFYTHSFGIFITYSGYKVIKKRAINYIS